MSDPTDTPPRGLGPLGDTSPGPDGPHRSHGVRPLLERLVKDGHLTAERARAMAPGFSHLSHAQELRVVLAMGRGDGQCYKVEDLSPYDWTQMRQLFIERHVEIVDTLGIQYVTTRDTIRTAQWLRSLGLVE